MTSLIVGYGSIGSRHARLLAQMGEEVAVVSRRLLDGVRRYDTIAGAIADFPADYVVIANETSGHWAALTELAATGFAGKVLVEKPLLHAPLPLPENRFERLAVAYNLRFHPVLRRLRELVAGKRIVSVSAVVASYLPSWRPGRDYRTTASGSQAAGGGALRDLSHELDALGWLLGPCRQLTALGGHFSTLEMDADDTFMLLARFDGCQAVSIHLDVLDRVGRRAITVNTEDDTIIADFMALTVTHAGGTETMALERDDMYLSQHRAMLNKHDPLHNDPCDADHGLAVVAMIAAAERAAQQAEWVTL